MDLDHGLDDVHPLHPYRHDPEMLDLLRKHPLPEQRAFLDLDSGFMYIPVRRPPEMRLFWSSVNGRPYIHSDGCPFPFFRLFRWSRRRAA